MRIALSLCLLTLFVSTSLAGTAPQTLPAAITAISTPQIPVFAGADPDQIPATDAIITQIIPLQTLSSVDVLNSLAPFLPAGTSVSANVGSNCIIVTERAAVVKRFVMIISLMDRPSGNVIELVQLQHANAAEAARIVNAALAEKR